LSVGVWAGNNDFTEKMKNGAAGLYVASPIWNEFMTKAYEIKSNDDNTIFSNEKNIIENEFFLPEKTEYFTLPEITPTSTTPMINGELAYKNIVKIDRISNKLATELTPPELIIEKIYQETHSILYYINKEDAQFENWESAVKNQAINQEEPPIEYDDIHTIENQPNIKITLPTNNSLINNQNITINTQVSANLIIKQVDFFLNNQLIGTDKTSPYSITFNPISYLLPQAKQIIKARIYDTTLNHQEDEIIVNINY